MQEINKLKGDRKTSPSPYLITRYRLGSRDGVIQRESNHERNIEYRGQSRSWPGVAGSWCRDVRLLSLGTIITDPVVRPHAEQRLPSVLLTTAQDTLVTEMEKNIQNKDSIRNIVILIVCTLVENKNNLRFY